MLGIEASGVPSSTTTSKHLLVEDSNEIKIVFSDLDGTLIHYPNPDEGKTEKKGELLEFPKSSTGMVGVISAKTLSLVDEIRNQHDVKFVLVSGMRTSTLLQRLPYLPRADAYCSENGGRIFYPVESNIDDDKDETKRIIRSIDSDDDESDIFWIHPKRYGHDGKTKHGGDPHRNRPFAIREDKAWRKKMTTSIGGDSFGPFSLQETFDDPATSSLSLNERDGLLWDFARDLIHKHDFVLDTKGYATCFRVNKKQQTSEAVANIPPSEISALLNQSPWKDKATIASSVNLSCVDFYPSCSGKKNCCLYLASQFFPNECKPSTGPTNETSNDKGKESNDGDDDDIVTEDDSISPEESFVAKHAVCMCDDDNDLEMALACQHAYLPDIASDSMSETIAKFPDHFTTTFRNEQSSIENDENSDSKKVQETDASDLALSLIWARTHKEIERAPLLKRPRALPKKTLSLALCCAALFVVLK